jgi:hypothetical protein
MHEGFVVVNARRRMRLALYWLMVWTLATAIWWLLALTVAPGAVNPAVAFSLFEFFGLFGALYYVGQYRYFKKQHEELKR